MVFSYNWLQSFFNKKLPKPEKLAELLTMHSFEVSGIKKVKSDYVLDIDVLPNRAGDCFSHFGVARECAALLKYKLKTPVLVSLSGTAAGKKDFIAVDVKHLQACKRYTAKVVVNIKIGPSPKWMRDRLEVCGLNSINNIVDVANYVMLEIGQPLHVFDFEKLDGGKIVVRFAREGEKITTLDNQVFNLNQNILVIADVKKPIAIAGIKGGKTPEISASTKTIVLESANFNPTTIREGSRELNLKTDASLRFEHGVDPNLTEFAINRAVYLIQKTAGGRVSKNSVDLYPKKIYPAKMKLDLKYVESLLGVKIPQIEIKRILESLGFKIMGLRNPLSIQVPTFRRDLGLPEDLIEEVGRIYGYEKIPAVFPVASLIPPARNDDLFWENIIKDILKENGFTEVYNYSFQKESGGVEVENPQSQEYRYLRQSLITGFLKNIQKNSNNFNKIKIFESGKIFNEKTEKRMLSGIMLGGDFYQSSSISGPSITEKPID